MGEEPDVVGMMQDHQRTLSWPARCYLWATHRLYNELAWAYDAVSWLVSLGQWSRWRRAALVQVRGRRVLEIGFGTGELLLEMAGCDWQACGLEPSLAMQRVTAHKLRQRGSGAPRVRGYAQALPFATGSFDAVVATFPAEYILWPATWHEVARVLRPPDASVPTSGGRFIIAGLVVEVDCGLFGRLAGLIHRGSAQGIVARCERLASSTGLGFSTVREDGKRPRSPVFVMEKRPTGDTGGTASEPGG